MSISQPIAGGPDATFDCQWTLSYDLIKLLSNGDYLIGLSLYSRGLLDWLSEKFLDDCFFGAMENDAHG